ncbi:MAG: SDR family oxidoreductase [Candidatus Omnitrophica bacterium]|nr:SDR family oxidoreductase [Candidatus Omnitrophota bacterium]
MIDIFNLAEEVAVVIGGSGELGGAAAVGLARAGARVAVVGLNTERGETRAKSIIDQGGTARFFQADALDPERLHAAHLEIEKTIGSPTILVNAAGGNDLNVCVTPDHPLEKITLENWRHNFDLNLIAGVLLPCQEIGTAMVARQRGSIINFASVSGHLPLSRVVAYSASKAGVLSLTKFLAREWATRGVRVNSITPGFFPTKLNRKLLFNPDGSPTPRTQSILRHTPMERFGDPAELTGAILFLASSKASGFVTGIDLCVDGGFLAHTI